MNNKTGKWLKWTGVGLGIAFALFLALFALDGGSPAGILIHLVPSLAVATAAIVGIRRPLAGGILAGILAIAFTIFFNTYRSPATFIFITLPLAAVAVLFAAAQER